MRVEDEGNTPGDHRRLHNHGERLASGERRAGEGEARDHLDPPVCECSRADDTSGRRLHVTGRVLWQDEREETRRGEVERAKRKAQT